jgi:hypothetical protein
MLQIAPIGDRDEWAILEGGSCENQEFYSEACVLYFERDTEITLDFMHSDIIPTFGIIAFLSIDSKYSRIDSLSTPIVDPSFDVQLSLWRRILLSVSA